MNKINILANAIENKNIINIRYTKDGIIKIDEYYRCNNDIIGFSNKIFRKYRL